jgi:transposase-like protein
MGEGQSSLQPITQQYRRAIKRRIACMLGFKSFMNAGIILAGIELANKIRKHQFSMGRDKRSWSLPLNELWRRALAN